MPVKKRRKPSAPKKAASKKSKPSRGRGRRAASKKPRAPGRAASIMSRARKVVRAVVAGAATGAVQGAVEAASRVSNIGPKGGKNSA
jgi:hypothetical protein